MRVAWAVSFVRANEHGIMMRCVLIEQFSACEVRNHVGVQPAAYTALAEKYLGTKERIRRGAVQLRDDGGYRLREYTHLNDETCFAGLLGIFYWGQSHGFNKE